MSTWASTIDNLTWQKDIIFRVAAGNLPVNGTIGNPRLSVQDHLEASCLYPNYLLKDSCRVANPTQSFQALTVGSLSKNYYQLSPDYAISEKNITLAFSRAG